MKKYFAFSDRFNGQANLIAEDLRVGHVFVVQEGRHALYERGRLIFDNGESRRVHRVWEGAWPKDNHVLDDVIAHINAVKVDAPQRRGARK